MIVCILIAAGTFMMGIFYGEKAERKRITEGFMKVFQENFGSGGIATTGTITTGNALTGSTTGVKK